MTRWLLLGLLAAAPLAAQTAPQGSCRTPALPEALAPWAVLRLDFEEDGSASTPGPGAVGPSQVRGRLTLADGRFGRALRTGTKAGGAELRYEVAALDLSRPGSLAFWVSPEGWASQSSRYVPFLRVRGTDRTSFVLERNVRSRGRSGESFIVGLFDLPGGEDHFLQLHSERWAPGSWHFVALRWDRRGFSVRIDDGDFVRHGVPGDVMRRAFSPSRAHAYWRVGDSGAEASRMDALTVFSRPMEEGEADGLFNDSCGAGTGSRARSR